jgi:hypothetical protein
VDPAVFINPGIVVFGIHAFVDDHRQTLFGILQAAYDGKHFIHYLKKSMLRLFSEKN